MQVTFRALVRARLADWADLGERRRRERGRTASDTIWVEHGHELNPQPGLSDLDRKTGTLRILIYLYGHDSVTKTSISCLLGGHARSSSPSGQSIFHEPVVPLHATADHGRPMEKRARRAVNTGRRSEL
jgi:hypothetical protein